MSEARDAEEELRLIRGVQDGQEGCLEALLLPYMPLLAALSRRFFSSANLGDELRQAGYIGLMQAARHFSAQRGVRFITYAVPWALGEMKRAMRQAADDTGVQAKRRQVVSKEAELTRKLGRSPHLSELAEACGLPMTDLSCVLEGSSVSLDAGGADDDRALAQTIGGGEEISLEQLDLRMALSSLDEAERRVIYLRFYRDRTQQETASLLGKSQSQISKLEQRALTHLRERLA